MEKIIKHQFYFPHPTEMVWEYLTKPELMELWLMKNDFKPVAGLDFQFRTDPEPKLDFDGIFYCRVLDVVPFERLSYSWTGGPGKGEISFDSVVVWTLQPKDKGTELFLEHSGFSKNENLDMYNALNHGWEGKFPKINNLLNTTEHGHTKS